MNKHFIKPDQIRNFAKIPNTIEYFLTRKNSKNIFPKEIVGKFDKKYQKVIFILLDGFGWKYYQKYKNKYPFLKRFSKQEGVFKISSQFPSTTCAHMNTINFGSPVEKHGLYEWYIYNKKTDSIITPLLFGLAGKMRDSLKGTIKPEEIYPSKTIYEKLLKHNVKSYSLLPAEFSNSTYSRASTKGAFRYGIKSLNDGFIKLFNMINGEKGPAYFTIYIDKMDAALHHFGEDTDNFNKEVDDIFTKLEEVFIKNLKTQNTLLMVSADHGQIMVDKEKTHYINLEIPQIIKYIKKNKKNDLLVPAGSARDMFLHIEEKYLEKAKNILKVKLKKFAEIYTLEELINEKVFDEKLISKNFLESIGNLVIIPIENNTVWWYEKDVFEMQFIGAHGGLTKDEMEIPLLLAKI